LLNFVEGIFKIANLFLSLIAGILAVSLLKLSSKQKQKKLIPWKVLIIALIFFVIQEVLGALRAFRVFESPYLTHIVPTVILGLLIIALVLQINMRD
jgi:predicted membrane-bound dolichyl-phosphate-mannose-protein mannosyltransferase